MPIHLQSGVTGTTTSLTRKECVSRKRKLEGVYSPRSPVRRISRKSIKKKEATEHMTEDMNRKRNREGADPQPVNPGDSPLAAAEGSSGEVAAPKRCGFTKQELMNILKEAEYNASSLAYRAYFFKNGDAAGKGVQVIRGRLDSDIDRCKECGLTISEHRDASERRRLSLRVHCARRHQRTRRPL